MSETLLREILVQLEGIGTRLDGIDARLEGVDARLEGVESRLDGVDARLEGHDSRLDAIERRQEEAAEEFRGLLAYLERRFERVESGVARNGAGLSRVGTALEDLGGEVKVFSERVSGNTRRLDRFEAETRNRFDRIEHSFLAWQGLAEERRHRLESA